MVSGKYAVNFAVKISCLRAYEDLEVSAIIFCEILTVIYICPYIYIIFSDVCHKNHKSLL